MNREKLAELKNLMMIFPRDTALDRVEIIELFALAERGLEQEGKLLAGHPPAPNWYWIIDEDEEIHPLMFDGERYTDSSGFMLKWKPSWGYWSIPITTPPKPL